MNVKDRLEQLIAEGGVIDIIGQGTTELTLARAAWLANPTRLRWCAIFPEHQGHVHETRYDKAVLDNGGRDVLLYRGGALVATVVPAMEATLSTDDVRDALVRWRARLAVPGNQAQFEEFFEEA